MAAQFSPGWTYSTATFVAVPEMSATSWTQILAVVPLGPARVGFRVGRRRLSC
ncbi:hypothetical protein ACGFWI_34205 [Streptomyces sp. NPDC048434]|uniref:hypothetical protein n=1 Tax=Streptomyces sp. NPDC048434 TaxID=3365549 RepID=UPI00371540AE